MEATDQPTSPDWADLLEELLDLIVDRIIKLSDYIRFSVVCKSWLSAALHQRHRGSLDLQKQVPLLLIPTKDWSRERRGLYSVTENKVLDLQLKVPYDRRCSGSSFGWLATADENLAITLINPFSGKTIQFTPVIETPKYEYRSKYEYRVPKTMYRVPKIVLSCDPSLMPNDFVVLALSSSDKGLAYIKPGQDRWTNVFHDGRSSRLFTDAIYYMGKFYVVDHYCCVRSIDVSGTRPQVTMVVPGTLKYTKLAYIAVSPEGDLLLIQRFLDHEHDYEPLMTSGFKVFKLLGLGGAEQFAERVEIHSLGDDSLFLGGNYSQSVPASKFSRCQPNCIYYTDDYFDGVPYGPFEKLDMGIYCMEDGNFSQRYQKKEWNRDIPPPIWISPLLP